MRPKFAYIRSKPLMEAYRAIPCQHCGRDDGTVCGAHSNQAKHGKGRGIKASDIYCASLCARCHTMVDQSYNLSRYAREAMWQKAHEQTWACLVIDGLWPQNVELPSTS